MQATWALNATGTGATAAPSWMRHMQETARRGPELPAWEAELKATEQLSAWQAGGSKERGACGGTVVAPGRAAAVFYEE